MKRISKISGLLMVVLVSIILFGTSCKKEKKIYQVKVRNECEINLLSTVIPFMKYDIKAFSLGDIQFGAIAKGSDSEYSEIESDTDYPISITYDVYLYNADELAYEFDRTETEDLGTEKWSDSEESDKFIMKIEMGDLLQAYKPKFTTYIAN
jgi:uncharacterized protein YcfL